MSEDALPRRPPRWYLWFAIAMLGVAVIMLSVLLIDTRHDVDINTEHIAVNAQNLARENVFHLRTTCERVNRNALALRRTIELAVDDIEPGRYPTIDALREFLPTITVDNCAKI